MIKIDVGDLFMVELDIEDEKWDMFMSLSCRRFLAFSRDLQTTCVGCLASEYIDLANELIHDNEMANKTQAMVELAVGINIMHTSSFPKHADMRIDLDTIIEAYAHGDEDDDEPEQEPKPSLNDDFKQFEK